MSGGEGGLSDIRSQWAEVREKPIRVGYASGRYDVVERGGIVTSVAGVSARQVVQLEKDERTEDDVSIWTPTSFRRSRRG